MRLPHPVQKAFDLLLVELRHIGETLQALGQTIDKKNAADQKASEPQLIPRAELEIPESVITEHRSDATESKRREKWKLRVEWAALLAVLAYTTVAALQWWEIHKAQRPWVGAILVTITAKQYVPVISKATLDERNFVINASLKNYGTSPAFYVNSEVIPVWEWRQKEFQVFQDKTCKFAKEYEANSTRSKGASHVQFMGTTIFPQSDLPWERNRSFIDGPVVANSGVLRIFLSGCTVYLDQDNRPHQTRWCAESWVISNHCAVRMGTTSTCVPPTPTEIKNVLDAHGFTPCQMGQYSD